MTQNDVISQILVVCQRVNKRDPVLGWSNYLFHEPTSMFIYLRSGV